MTPGEMHRIVMRRLTEPSVSEARPKLPAYRDLSEAQIEMINRVKAKAERVRTLVEGLAIEYPDIVDARWLAIGKTDLQKGFMAVIRAIARPEGF